MTTPHILHTSSSRTSFNQEDFEENIDIIVYYDKQTMVVGRKDTATTATEQMGEKLLGINHMKRNYSKQDLLYTGDRSK